MTSKSDSSPRRSPQLPRITALLAPAIALAAGLATLGLILSHDPASSIAQRQPNPDNDVRPDQTVTTVDPGVTTRGPAWDDAAALRDPASTAGQPTADANDWPQFRGPDRTGRLLSSTPIATDWPDAGPPIQWRIPLGEGYAAPAIRQGLVYLIDYDRQAQTDVVRCLTLSDGREVWRHAYAVKIKRNHGMSRTVPVVTDKFVITFGPMGHVVCLDRFTGQRRWALSLVQQYASEIPDWYAGQCPLVLGDTVIIAPAGDEVLMTALRLDDGQPVWAVPNTPGLRMSHSSITPMTLDGRTLLLYCGIGGVVAVEPPAAGDAPARTVWSTSDWQVPVATICSPIPLDDGRVFFADGYRVGAAMFKLTPQPDGAVNHELLYRLQARTYGTTQQTGILHDNHLFGVRPNGELTCLSLDGTIAWTSSLEHRFGLGPLLIVNQHLLVMDDDGWLTLARATPQRFEPIARARVLDGHESWGPMAISGSRLLVRDFTELRCLDLAPGD